MLRHQILSCLVLLTLALLLVACDKQEEATTGGSPAGAASGPGHGQDVYDKTCRSCHDTGVAGAPKLGDQAAWKDRIAQGNDALVQSALNGKGSMPPKGGARTLNENDIRAAVEYMVEQSR
jgi:cytochrome c5